MILVSSLLLCAQCIREDGREEERDETSESIATDFKIVTLTIFR